jgi:molybdenum cofactor sulfurtransferase
MMPLSFIEHAATSQSISLRTGCMCNTGGVAAILDAQKAMEAISPGMTRIELEEAFSQDLGVVRISLGLATTFKDVWKIVRFGATIGNEGTRQTLWNRYLKSVERSSKHGHGPQKQPAERMRS